VLQRGDEGHPHRLAPTARSAGSLVSGSRAPSGAGSTQVVSGSGAPSEDITGGDASGDMSIGMARCLRPFSASKQTLVAIRYIHERSEERPSKRSTARQARTIVSWTASSAS
jgi:hypothetical protein